MDVRELAERLEMATGPDRELNEAIWAWAHGWSHPLFDAAIGDKRQYHEEGEKQDYTSSIDASLALVEQMLPEWDAALYLANCTTPRWCCQIEPCSAHGPQYEGNAPTPALSILRAFIAAFADTDPGDAQ